MMNTTLVVMAAGLGSRFGGGIKQLTPVGPAGEIIMEYSVYDAVRAGFGRIVFVISKRIEGEFKELLWERIRSYLTAKGVRASYVLQETDDIPGKVPEGRIKPWGTGHAVLAASSEIDGPFAVINADDYYGAGAYRKLYDQLTRENENAMMGFNLGKTLSSYGSVTRGLCLEKDGYLTALREMRGLVPVPGGAQADGVFFPEEMSVSMNMWGFQPQFIGLLKDGFSDFLKEMTDPLKDEYLIPVFVGRQVRSGKMRVKILRTDDEWFGMTYREDAERAREAIACLTDRGLYPARLYGGSDI